MSPCPSCPLHARSPCHSVCHVPLCQRTTPLVCHAFSMPRACATLSTMLPPCQGSAPLCLKYSRCQNPMPLRPPCQSPTPSIYHTPSMLGAPSTFSSHIHSLPEAYASLSTTFYLMPGPMPLSQPCSISDKGPCHSVPQAESSVYFSLLHRGQIQRP